MNKLPLTVRRSIEVLGLIGIGYVITKGREIIMPLIMAGFLALLLLPVFRWLRGRRIPESLAIFLSLIMLILVVAGIGTFFSFQVASLLSDIPEMQKNLNLHWQDISHWIASRWNIPIQKQLAVINNQIANIGNNIVGTLQGAALTLGGVMIFIGLLPIYIFLILFYRQLIRKFVFLWFNEENHHEVADAFNETETIVKYYLVGLLIQITYLTVLVGGILLLFGIKHAILIGLMFGILNLIPYIGALIGNVLGVVITLTSSQDLWQIWAVLGTIAAVQFLDNNILMPRIVGSRVQVNALASIVGIIIGGALAGVPGMFLSIPLMAMLKIIFEKSPQLRQWGVLLGEPVDEKGKPGQTPVQKMKDSLERERNREIDEEKKRDKNV
jgi:predicted PurR-regulated permease PerM